MPPSSAVDRQALRTQLRRARKDYVTRHRPSLPLPDQLRDVLLTSRCVGGYRAMTSEADPDPILQWCADHAIPLALPYLAGRSMTMTFKSWSPGAPLEGAKFGYEQPVPAAPDVIPDLFLVPLVGFDAQGNRMGQGAGHYDRYFEAHPLGQRIGLAWECQRVTHLDAQPWDVPLHAMLTDKGWHDVTTHQGPNP